MRLTPRQKRAKAKLDAWNAEARRFCPSPMTDEGWENTGRVAARAMEYFDSLSPEEREVQRGSFC